MVRGLCPRDWMRGAVDVTVRAVVDAGAIGHAERPRQRCPGGHVTTVHRGRCTLQAAAKPALRNMTQRAWKLYPDNPPTSRLRRNIPTRTPRRGRRPRRPFRRMTDDVFAMRKHSPHVVGRTVPGAPPLSFYQRRAGVEARPYGGWLRGMTGNVIAPHPRCTNPSVTPLRAATAPLSGEPRGEQRFAVFAHLFTTMRIPTFS